MEDISNLEAKIIDRAYEINKLISQQKQTLETVDQLKEAIQKSKSQYTYIFQGKSFIDWRNLENDYNIPLDTQLMTKLGVEELI